MTTPFLNAVQQLLSAQSEFSEGKTKSVQFADIREASLASALQAMANEHGVQLETPLQINSRGEFNVVAKNINPASPFRSSSFGDTFSKILNQYNPRTGTLPGAIMIAESSWCYLNHFEVERLVLNQHQISVSPGPESRKPRI